jgi:hypothetical protein
LWTAVVFLHGGPGGGCDEKDRSFFNPTKYKVKKDKLKTTFGCQISDPSPDHPVRPAWSRKVYPVRVIFEARIVQLIVGFQDRFLRGKHDVGFGQGY